MTDPIPLHANASTAPHTFQQCRNMFAIASGKGGVGKTWFAITLCQALAQRDKRVLLFDGDLGLANVDIQLGLTPEKDLGSVIEGQTSMANAILHYSEGKFDILAGALRLRHIGNAGIAENFRHAQRFDCLGARLRFRGY